MSFEPPIVYRKVFLLRASPFMVDFSGSDDQCLFVFSSMLLLVLIGKKLTTLALFSDQDTGNKVSRRGSSIDVTSCSSFMKHAHAKAHTPTLPATIQGPQNITLGGKTIIHPGVILRGDLKRQGIGNKASVVLALGKYSLIGEGCVIRPPGKCYRGVFNFYPVRIGDHVHIGPGSIVEAAQIGNFVQIGKNCIIGKFTMIKDCVKIADNTVIPDMSVIPPFAHISGAPGKHIEDLPESTEEIMIVKTKAFYNRFRADSSLVGHPSRERS
ncbi:Dynactin, subunit p25 [Phaffia rhodozyma]|uniref:Dynactin subunit 5 n=1 Tax=Phaffia rhodozyma TaxID=264483 RepID=A0A0F7SKR5_PHARH|nr:Dynactin, subunit p25 [Phaffia rhodozyma]